jgi:hypothetical protein
MRLGTLRSSIEREGMNPATDQPEAVALGKIALRCDLARDAIFGVLLACQVGHALPQAEHVVDRLVKGKE